MKIDKSRFSRFIPKNELFLFIQFKYFLVDTEKLGTYNEKRLNSWLCHLTLNRYHYKQGFTAIFQFYRYTSVRHI